MDRDFLFGVFAVQLGFARSEAVMAAASAWLVDATKSIPARLLADGAISEQQSSMLDGIVDEALKAHGGDAKKTLETLGGERMVFHSFGGSLLVDDAGAVSLAPQVARSGDSFEDSAAVTPEAGGRYRMGDDPEIGRGGIGRVLVAFDEHLGREIAVKELLSDGQGSGRTTPGTDGRSRTGAIAARFLREARVTGQLEHPNIVPVYEVGQREDGTYYYTMKLVRGRTLASALQRCRSLGERLKLLHHFVDLCNAIAYAHSRGVIHRDIKTDNVMLGEFGETVVLDWGLAKIEGKKDIRGGDMARELAVLHDAGSGQTMAGSAIGTPAYMSPEQADGRVEDIDARSDIWSLGAVLYEVLTGKPPFEGVTPYEILGKVLKDEVSVPRDPDGAIPAELSAVAMKALTRDKDQRYQLAGELADEIGAYMSGGRIAAYQYSSWELIKSFVRKNRAVSALALTLVLLVAATAVGLYSAYQRAEAERSNAQAAEQLALRRTAEALLEAGLGALDARSMFELRARVRSSLEIADTAVGRALWKQQARAPLYGGLTVAGESQSNGVSFSPDGRLLAACGYDGGTVVIEVASGAVLASFAEPGTMCRHVAFVADGDKVLLGSREGPARLWTFRSGQVERIAGITAYSGHFALSRDRRQVAFGTAGGEARVWDLASARQSHRWVVGAEGVWSTAIDATGDLVATGDMGGGVSIRSLARGKVVRVLENAKSAVRVLAFHPSERLLFVALDDGTSALWNADTGEKVRSLVGHQGRIWSAAFSPDGALLATGSEDQSIRLWDVDSGELRASLQGKFHDVLSVEFSPDNKLLASASLAFTEPTLSIWRVDEALAEAAAAKRVTSGAVTGVAMDGAGRRIAFVDVEGWLRQVDLPSGTSRGLEGFSGVEEVALSPDGSTVATAGADWTVRLWDAVSGRQQAILGGHRNTIQDLRFSSDGSLLAAASADTTVRLWSTATGRLEHVLRGHTNRVTSVRFRPDDRLLVTASNDGSIRLWDPRDGQQRDELSGGIKTVRLGLSYRSDGSSLAWGDWRGDVSLVELGAVPDDSSASPAASSSGSSSGSSSANEAPKPRVVGHCEGSVTRTGFHPSARRLAVSCLSAPPQLIALEGNETQSWDRAGAGAAVTFHPGGQWLIVAGADGSVRPWDLKTRRPLWRAALLRDNPPELCSHRGWQRLDGGKVGAGSDAAWRRAVEADGWRADESPGGGQLCLLTFDDLLELWSIERDERLLRVPAPQARRVLATSFGCAVLDAAGVAQVFRPEGAPLRVPGTITAIALDDDGLLAAGEEGIVRLGADGQVGAAVPAGAGITALSRVGSRLAVAYRSGRMDMLSPDSKEPALALDMPASKSIQLGVVDKLLAGPASTLLVGGRSGFVGVWDTGSGKLLEHAWLHGAPLYMTVVADKLYAASEVGDFEVIDLAIYGRDYCDLMREVWAEAPIVWQAGKPLVAAPDPGHRCAQGR